MKDANVLFLFTERSIFFTIHLKMLINIWRSDFNRTVNIGASLLVPH